MSAELAVVPAVVRAVDSRTVDTVEGTVETAVEGIAADTDKGYKS